MKLKSILLTTLATLGFTVATIAQVPSYVPTNGLVGWWPFNGNANDESGNENNGIVNGATLTADRFGTVNSAYDFDGNDWIQVAHSELINFNNVDSYSISVWFNGDDCACEQSIMEKWHAEPATSYPYVIRFGLAGNGTNYSLAAGGYDGSQPQNTCVYPTASALNWNNVVIVYYNFVNHMYFNGVLVDTDSTLLDSFDNTDDLYIGRRGNEMRRFFYGDLDDIGIWNRALTPQEVIELYNASSCSNDLVINSQKNRSITGGSVSFVATKSDPNPSFIWQSDLGQGFQTLNNFGNYSGVNTNTLTINNLKLTNHLQQIRAISTSGNCIDTSNVATITLTDTCINYITVTDTLIINTTITVLSPPNNVNTITVYPNPASTHITIDYGDYALMNGYTLQIVNTLGQTMYITPINQQSSYIELTTWTGNGLYFVQIIDPQSNVIENRKILIQ